MYVDPFVAGVVCTLMFEAMEIIIYAVIMAWRK